MEWFTQLLQTFATIFPRLVHIKSTDKGVCFKREKVFKLEPGIHWYWPLWSEVFIQPVVRQTRQLPAQTLTTKDGISVTISVTIRFEINDVIAAYGNTFDFLDTIQDVAQGEVTNIVRSTVYQDFFNENLDILLSRKIRGRLKPFGVALKKAFIAEFSPCYPIRLWQMSS